MIELGISRGPSKQPLKKETVAERVAKEESKERIKTTEREFYFKNYQAIADKRNAKLLGKIGLSKKVTVEDIRDEFENLRQEDIERRKHPEYKEWNERLQVVLSHFKENRDSKEGKKYRILIFAPGGGMRGPLGAGQVAGLNEVGLTADKADILAGVSAGLANLAYYAGGKLHTLRGAAIYYHQCATKAFLNLLGRPQHVMDARVIGDAMRRGPQALDQDAVRAGPELYSGITPQHNPHASVEFANVKESKPDIIAPMEASMNVPILFAPGVKVNTGTLTIEYIDGAFSSLPVEELIDRFHPTDILILPNVPFGRVEDFKKAGSWVEKLPAAGSIGTIRKFLQVSSEFRKMLDYFQREKGVNVGMMWSVDRGLGTLNNDPNIVRLGMFDSIKDTIEQCGEKLPKSVEMYLPEEDKYLEIEIAA